MTVKDRLRQLIAEQVHVVLTEDYMRGIPDFALSDVASEASESLKRHLRRHIQQVSPDPVKQRQMMAAANQVAEELEKEMKELMEDKLLSFMRNT